MKYLVIGIALIITSCAPKTELSQPDDYVLIEFASHLEEDHKKNLLKQPSSDKKDL